MFAERGVTRRSEEKSQQLVVRTAAGTEEIVGAVSQGVEEQQEPQNVSERLSEGIEGVGDTSN